MLVCLPHEFHQGDCMFPNQIRILVMQPLQCLTLKDKVRTHSMAVQN